MQKTTLKEGAGTKIIIWQYHPLPPCSSHLIRQEEDVRQGGWSSSALLSNLVASAAGVSSRLTSSAGISHSGQVPLHNASPSWAPPPHLTLNKHPLHHPSLHKTEKVRYIQASLGMTLPSQSQSSGHRLPQQLRLRPKHLRERRGSRGQPRRCSPLPQSPQGEAHAGRRQKSLRASQLHRSPLAKERRLAWSWEQQVAGRGAEPGAVCSVQSQQLFVVESLQFTCRRRWWEMTSPHLIPNTQGMQSPPSLCPHS